MWSLIRTLLVALALAGFVGQTTAHAMPMCGNDQAMAATAAADCAHMAGMPGMAKASLSKSQPKSQPSKGMPADCMGKMCCTAEAITPPATGEIAGVSYERVSYSNPDLTRDGLEPSPPYSPPIRLA